MSTKNLLAHYFETHTTFSKNFALLLALLCGSKALLIQGPRDSGYSWIGYQLDIWRRPTFWLSVSNFKSVTSFTFLTKNYMRHHFWIFCNTSNCACLASFHDFSTVFQVFYVKYLMVELNVFFVTKTIYHTCIRFVKLIRACIFLIHSQKLVFCTMYFLLVFSRRTSPHLTRLWSTSTQLDFLKHQFSKEPRRLRSRRT